MEQKAQSALAGWVSWGRIGRGRLARQLMHMACLVGGLPTPIRMILKNKDKYHMILGSFQKQAVTERKNSSPSYNQASE
jgi:hypothetical protein